MKQEKDKLLLEENSVSAEVHKLSKEIQSAIIEDAENINIQNSANIPLPFKQHGFIASFQDEFPFIPDVKLFYIIYFAENEREYELATVGYECDLNSSYDCETNELKIVTCLINGEFSSSFSEEIMHEITHLYQYSKGMKKRESLYNKTLDLYSLGNANIDAYYIGLAMYYTFPHKQDAFAHQFFAKQLSDIDSFEPYQTFQKAINVIQQHYQNKQMQDAIHYLDYNSKDYLKRLHFGFKRFVRKLRNASIALRKTNERKQVSETNIRRMNAWAELFESHNRNIIFINEAPFDFSMSKIVRLTSEQLENIIFESVKNIINEASEPNMTPKRQKQKEIENRIAMEVFGMPFEEYYGKGGMLMIGPKLQKIRQYLDRCEEEYAKLNGQM